MKLFRIITILILVSFSTRLFSQCQYSIPNYYYVTTPYDIGTGSLRDVILQANADNIGGTINILWLDTLYLNSPLPIITCDSLFIIFPFNVIDCQNLVSDPVIQISAPHSCYDPYSVTFINVASAYFLVTNTNDSGPGSFRQAILTANFSSSYDYIHFNIPGPAPHKIQLASQLPTIRMPLEIRGWTQPPSGWLFPPRIELDGSTIVGAPGDGLYFDYPSYQYYAHVDGLFIHNFNYGIETNHVGHFVCGKFNSPNVLSGNYSHGGYFLNDSSLLIQYNYIGTDTTGSAALPNPTGLRITRWQPGISIIYSNIISGNGKGLLIWGGDNFSVKSNLFGTDRNGNYAIPNTIQALWSAGQNVVIGGTGASDGNVFSGNIWSTAANGPGIVACEDYPHIIQKNKFGTNLAGTDTIPNLNASPLYLEFADNSLIGGSTVNARNIITASNYPGILIEVSSNLTIQNNYFGTNASGTTIYHNSSSGIFIGYSCFTDSTLIHNNLIAGNVTGIIINSCNSRQRILNNTIRNNSYDGIGNAGNYNLFSHNSIYDNGGKGIFNCCPSNYGILPPLITSISPDSVGGTSLPGATIELYYSQSQNNTPQGKTFISTVMADTSGNWKYIGSITDVMHVTATQTDSSNNTSEFAALWAQVTPDVWPGDCNYDLAVDNFDFLYLNIANGDTGIARTGASINWIPQPCPNWSKSFVAGINHKHADTNGDGTVNLQDTLAINQNYGQTHPFRILLPSQQSNVPDFFLIAAADTVASNSSITFEIHAGDSSAVSVDSLYGIAYSLSFDASLVDTSQIQIQYSPSVLGTLHTDMESFEKDFYSSGQIDAAVCRTDHNNQANFSGVLGTINLKIPANVPGLSVLHVTPFQLRGLTYSEKAIVFNSIGDSVVIVNCNQLATVNFNDTVICKGDSLLANALTIFPMQTAWYLDSVLISNGLTFSCDTLSGGNHTIEMIATSSSCSQTIIQNVFVDDPPKPTFNVNGNLLTSSSVTSNQWFLNGIIITGANQNTYTVQQHGWYVVSVVDSFGCIAFSDSVYVSPVGIQELSSELQFSLNPNLITNQQLQLVYSLPQNKSGIFQIYDITGKVVFKYTLPPWSNEQSFKLPEISDGVYNCVITSGELRMSKKIAVIKE